MKTTQHVTVKGVKLSVGDRFHRLVIESIIKEGKRWMAHCKCECGASTRTHPYKMLSGHTKSCSCLQKDTVKWTKTTHGGTHHELYPIWTQMIGRCRNRNNPGFKNYGGRGIKVCERWQDFANFLADMGERPNGLEIERIDNDKGYCKENCKWETRAQQSKNKRSNVMLTFNGRTKCVADWNNEMGFGRWTIANRIKCGWSVEMAISTPTMSRSEAASFRRMDQKQIDSELL